jgi:hypothetical protein
VTIGVLTLTFRTVFWQAPGPDTNSTLNALQFAAKLHEAFIIVSLSAIVFHRVRYELTGPRGVPLGFLSSGLQLNSWTYLFGWEFWSPTTGRNLTLTLLILTSFTLAALAGPSSALTMIPKLDWWHFAQSEPQGYRFSAYVHCSPDILFPGVVTGDHVPPHCFDKNATTLPDCPSAGFSTILQLPLLTSDPDHLNISMWTGNSETIRLLAGAEPTVSEAMGLFVASSIPDFIASALVRYWQDVNAYAARADNTEPDPLSLVSRAMVKALLGDHKSVTVAKALNSSPMLSFLF